MKKPILVFGYGNLSRGDDAVGPLLLEYLEQHADLTRIELLTDFQLQIEHVMDMQERELVVFVDASVSCEAAFEFKSLQPLKDHSYTSHAMTPAALLLAYQSVLSQTPPPCFLLSIKATSFELGEGLSPNTAENLQQACGFALQQLQKPIAEVDWAK
jgi:hydrogenase maturation protease